MAEANEVISPRLGLPDLPVVEWPDDDEDLERGLHWKTVVQRFTPLLADALGRTTTVPAADTANLGGGNVTATYHVTDLADTITQNGRTTDYTLDVTGERIRSWTDNASGALVQAINHYDGDEDSPFGSLRSEAESGRQRRRASSWPAC